MGHEWNEMGPASAASLPGAVPAPDTTEYELTKLKGAYTLLERSRNLNYGRVHESREVFMGLLSKVKAGGVITEEDLLPLAFALGAQLDN